MEHNQLTALPRDIGMLRNLKKLTLHENPLTVLPPEMILLTNLMTLTIADKTFRMSSDVERFLGSLQGGQTKRVASVSSF